MAHASALGRCTHHLAGQATMPAAGDVFVCAPRADIAWAGGSRVGCHHWRRHLGGSLPLFSGVNAARVAPIGADLRKKEGKSKTSPRCEKVDGDSANPIS